MEKRVVLVTGGKGLVGSAVQELVVKNSSEDIKGGEWVFASRKDADLRNAQECKDLFSRIKPTHVMHLAATVGGLFANMSRPLDFCLDNLKININVLECCKEFKVRKVVSCLSTCIFPAQPPSYPMDESMIHEGPPHSSNKGYAYAKRMIDVLNEAFRHQYPDLGVFTSVVPTNIYGPHDNFDLKEAHVLPALMHRIALAKKNGTPLVVGGSGKPLRQFIYSKDLARLLLWSLDHYDSSDPLILSKETEHCRSRATAKFSGKVQFDVTQPDGQLQKPVTTYRLQHLLPSFEFTPLEQGLAETWEWFEKNLEKARGVTC